MKRLAYSNDLDIELILFVFDIFNQLLMLVFELFEKDFFAFFTAYIKVGFVFDVWSIEAADHTVRFTWSSDADG